MFTLVTNILKILNIIHRCSPHLTTHGAQDLPQELGHLALLEGQVSLPVEDPEDDVAEAGDGDGAPQGLGPLTAPEVDQVEPGPPAKEHGAGLGLGLAGDRVLVHVQREQEVRVAALKGNYVSPRFYNISIII